LLPFPLHLPRSTDHFSLFLSLSLHHAISLGGLSQLKTSQRSRFEVFINIDMAEAAFDRSSSRELAGRRSPSLRKLYCPLAIRRFFLASPCASFFFLTATTPTINNRKSTAYDQYRVELASDQRTRWIPGEVVGDATISLTKSIVITAKVYLFQSTYQRMPPLWYRGIHACSLNVASKMKFGIDSYANEVNCNNREQNILSLQSFLFS